MSAGPHGNSRENWGAHSVALVPTVASALGVRSELCFFTPSQHRRTDETRGVSAIHQDQSVTINSKHRRWDVSKQHRTDETRGVRPHCGLAFSILTAESNCGDCTPLSCACTYNQSRSPVYCPYVGVTSSTSSQPVGVPSIGIKSPSPKSRIDERVSTTSASRPLGEGPVGDVKPPRPVSVVQQTVPKPLDNRTALWRVPALVATLSQGPCPACTQSSQRHTPHHVEWSP